MRNIDEPDVMPPCECKTSHGINVRLTPQYKNGPGVPTAIILTLADVPVDVSPADDVRGQWTSHHEAFKAGAEAAERWVSLLKSKKE